MVLDDGKYWYILIVNMCKVNFGNIVVAFQVYEWFALWKMIYFQKDYKLPTVSLARDKFRVIERRHWLVFRLIIVSLYIFSVFTVCASFIIKTISKDSDVFYNVWIIKQGFAISENICNLIFATFTCSLFMYSAWKRHRYEYIANRQSFLI